MITHRATILWQGTLEQRMANLRAVYMPVVDCDHLFISAQPWLWTWSWLYSCVAWAVVLPQMYNVWHSSTFADCECVSPWPWTWAVSVKATGVGVRSKNGFCFWPTRKLFCQSSLHADVRWPWTAVVPVATPLQVLIIKSCRSSEFPWVPVNSHLFPPMESFMGVRYPTVTQLITCQLSWGGD